MNKIGSSEQGFQATNNFQGFDYQIADTGTLTVRKGESLTKLQVPIALTNRKIYGWAWSDGTGNNVVRGELRAFLNGQRQPGLLPIEVGFTSLGDATIQRPIVSVVNSGGMATTDTIGLTVPSPATGQPGTPIILQPLYIPGVFDELRLGVTEVLGAVANFRFIIACISTS